MDKVNYQYKRWMERKQELMCNRVYCIHVMMMMWGFMSSDVGLTY